MAFLLMLLALAGSSAWADEQEPVSIRADQVEYFGVGKVEASGNVEAVYREMKVTCDHAVIYTQTKDAYLDGRVRMIQPGGFLKGEEMIYNFQTRKGMVVQAEGEVGLWRSRGERAEKISAESFLHREGYFTSCDFEQPHSRLQAKEVQVFLDDKVVLKHVVFYVGNVPLFYLPSYTHLLDDKRPRVTLIPGKSKEWGAFLLTSWRVYLHENLQGQFHVDYREQLDLATGFDVNYRLPVGGEGIFREYYTNERSLQRKHFYSRFTSPDEDHPTAERERYRFQLRHIWDVDESTRATLEYNRSRDPTLIKDFFLREFEENGPTPLSYFQVVRTAPWYGLTFLATRRINRFETVTEMLPSITFDLRPLELPWLPTWERWLKPSQPGPGAAGRDEYGWHYRANYHYEHSDLVEPKDGTKDSLYFLDALQEIFYPMRLIRRLNFRPFFQFRQTSFSRGAVQLGPLFRQAAAAGFDLSGKAFRIFPVEGKILGVELNRLRHVITPTVAYLYQAKPTLSADRFLRSDGLAKSNKVTLGMEHKLQTKRFEGGSWKAVDLARFTASMPYDIEGTSGAGGEWMNTSMDLELIPNDWIRIESDAAIDPHIGKVTTINADIVAYPKQGWRGGGRRIGEVYNSETGEIEELPWAVGVGWRYQRKTSAQLTLETEFNLTRKWRVGIYQLFDVKRFATENTTLGSRTVKKIYDLPEYEYRLRRDLHEWTVELVYSIRRDEGDTILLLFRLKAAPDLPVDFSRTYHKPKAGRNFPKGGSAPSRP